MKRVATYSIAFCLGALIAILIFVSVNAPVANAAPATSDNCTLEGTVNGIGTYYCEGDKGPDYLTTSVGVSVPVP